MGNRISSPRKRVFLRLPLVLVVLAISGCVAGTKIFYEDYGSEPIGQLFAASYGTETSRIDDHLHQMILVNLDGRTVSSQSLIQAGQKSGMKCNVPASDILCTYNASVRYSIVDSVLGIIIDEDHKSYTISSELKENPNAEDNFIISWSVLGVE